MALQETYYNYCQYVTKWHFTQQTCTPEATKLNVFALLQAEQDPQELTYF
jgi:hypothetical protein